MFELVIYTASTRPYCDPIVDSLDTEKLIKHRLYRINCTQIHGKPDS